jgi:hypothetical protein
MCRVAIQLLSSDSVSLILLLKKSKHNKQQEEARSWNRGTQVTSPVVAPDETFPTILFPFVLTASGIFSVTAERFSSPSILKKKILEGNLYFYTTQSKFGRTCCLELCSIPPASKGFSVVSSV